ncbi:SpoIIE family protein phosphatase [Breznakiellaceae bacterium SP9]
MSSERTKPSIKKTFVEVDYKQVSKYGQSAPGDVFYSQRDTRSSRIIATLSDGMGSGIKAGVLATLTSTMISKFMLNKIPIKKSAELIMDTLPVSKEIGISYATFTVVDINPDNKINIVEYDNPHYIMLREGRIYEPEKQIIPFERKYKETGPLTPTELLYSSFTAFPGDRIVFFSDGVTQAGLGEEATPAGWGREAAMRFIIDTVARTADISARDLSATLVKAALGYHHNQAKDDISAAVVYFRKPRELLVITGPPWRPENDAIFADIWKNFAGKKIISGGTTAKILSRELGLEIKHKETKSGGRYPAEAEMEGAAMVSEGILTLATVAKILENTQDADRKNKTALGIVELFLNCDRLYFVVGTKINDANYDPSMPIELEVRRSVVRRIATILETKYLKEVDIRFY